MMWAKSNAETAPEPVNSAMKLVRLLCALRKMSSAAFWPNLPATTNARPKPGKIMEIGSLIAVSVADMVLASRSSKHHRLLIARCKSKTSFH
ncbi:MAG: hypothetical protein WAW46_10210, partial [Polaromonas sp.]